MPIELAALAAVALLAAVHVFAHVLWPLEADGRARRSPTLSMAGGAAVAYVFVHLLPELSAAQEPVREAVGGPLDWLERHVYLLALVGLAVFYGLENHARASRRGVRAEGGPTATGLGVAGLSFAVFAGYNVLIGYLLVDYGDGPLDGMALFALAIGVHLVVIDHALREHHRHAYARLGRWVLAGGLVVGWAVGVAVDVGDVVVGLAVAFLAGGIILNTLKEELPEERRSRFGYFLLGAGAYTALLLAV